MRLLFLERIDVVVRHAFLGDDDLFGSVDDKISSLVVDAFAQIAELRIILIFQYAKEQKKDNGDVSQELLSGPPRN